MIRNVGMIGTGNMGSAILRGIVEASYVKPTQLTVFDVSRRKLKEIEGLDIVASGGISFEDEITALKDIVYGAILGKALYSGALDLKKAIELAK